MPEVSVVVCMDTEGPCADPGNPELLADWDSVDAAMDKLFDETFRRRIPDTAGGGLRIGWFFLTWTGFRTNPRGRALGYHAVRDHYLARWGDALAALGDEQCWHYHQPAPSGIGNEWGTDWSTSDEYDRILARQLLERSWFPVCYRAGGTIMSNDSSRWVDRWFPVDYSNRAPLVVPGLADWSTSPADWSLYRPDPADYRLPGSGQRLMARCLDLVTNVHRLSETDVVSAFERARAGEPAILSVFDHDYRDIHDRFCEFSELVASVGKRFADVPWRYAAPVEAVRRYLGASPPSPLRVTAELAGRDVVVETSEPVFQADPFLAVRSEGGDAELVSAGLLRESPTRWRWRPESEWLDASVGVSTALGEAAVASVASR